MSDDLAARIAAFVADADDGQLASVLAAVRDSASDARALRRQIERRAPVAVRDDLLELLNRQHPTAVFLALDVALTVAWLERERHGRGQLVWTGPPTKDPQGAYNPYGRPRARRTCDTEPHARGVRATTSSL